MTQLKKLEKGGFVKLWKYVQPHKQFAMLKYGSEKLHSNPWL